MSATAWGCAVTPAPPLAAGGLGVLGRRLVLAFTVVAATAIALVTVAALVGTDRGLSSQLAEQRRALATNLAVSAAQAYDQAGGWTNADLDEVRTERELTATDLPEDLTALYAKLRELKGGVGAAALHRRQCGG